MLAFGALPGSSSARQSARFGTVRPEVQILSPRPFFCLFTPLEAYFSGMVSETSLVPQLRPAPRLSFRAFVLTCRWRVGIVFAYCALTAVMLWPLVRTVNSAVAETDGDPLLNAWALRWVQHALLTDPLHLYDANLFAPASKSLLFSEALLPQALTAWPIWLVTHDALVSYNLSVLLTYPACAVAMYALCRALGANRGGSFVAGLLYAFAPFRLDNTAHLQVLSMQGMPLALLAIVWYVRRPARWRGALVAATFAYLALSSVYYLVIFGTGLVAFLLVEALRQRRVLFSRVGVGVAVWLLIGAGVVAALDAPYLAMRQEQGIARTLDEAYDDSAHRASYVTAVPGSLIWSHVLPTSGVEHSALYPGATLLALAAVGLVAARRKLWLWGLVAASVVGFALSFGPTWGEKEVGYPLPYRFLYQHVLAFQGLRGPDRFASLVLLALAPLAALGATALWGAIASQREQWRARIVPALLATVALTGIAIADDAARLLPTVPVDRSAATLAPYRWLATRQDTGVVAEFPTDDAVVRTGFFSIYHWQPVVWGHSGFVPEAHYRLLNRFSHGEARWPGTDDLDALADMGVRTLVIHRDEYSADELTHITADFATLPKRIRLRTTRGNADIYALTPATGPRPRVTDVSFAATDVGRLDDLPGKITVSNPAPVARMLFTQANPRLTAEVRDVRGKIVSRQLLDVTLPAMMSGDTDAAVKFVVRLPPTPGAYTVRVTAAYFDQWPVLPPVTVRVIDPTALPHLKLVGTMITGPALYAPRERVAMWATLKDGRTVPLPDTQAQADRTIAVDLGSVPSGAVQIVAHGVTSGVELWVVP